MAQAKRRASTRALPGDDPLAETTPARVLVVDDDRRNLLTISEVLKDVGEIVCASSGEEALRHLLRDEYAVILLDVIMPGLDGYQTAGMIRQRASCKTTPIIFLTAINKEDAHMLRGYDAGAVDFLFKPFDPLMLRSKVGVFVELFLKTREIRLKAESEQRLLQENLLANTQKLQALKDLKRAEERQEAILRSLPLCIHSRSVEPPFGTFFIYGAVEQLTGFAAETFTRDPGFGLGQVHPDDAPLVEQALKGALRSGTYAVEFRWQRGDGAYRRFLDQGVVSNAQDGAPSEIMGTLLDITERRQLEDQLTHAQKLDAIGKLTGGVAHDFNNLLASILSGLGLLKRHAEMSADAERIFDMTQHAARQGADLIARMLAFSRRQHLDPKVFDLKRLSEALALLLTPMLGGLLQLRWHTDPEIWPVYVDPNQLQLAMMNLVINARDAMAEGGTIVIRGQNRKLDAPTAELGAGEYAVLRVEDSGRGIPPENLAKVLEPFFTTKDVGHGTGLGLSTVYGFVKQSGGSLRIESKLGQGTAVEIWLPRAQAAAPAEEPVDAPTPLPAETREKKRPTVLLIDDSTELLDFTADHLRDRGFDVVGAGGGAEALALLEREPDRYDVIVTDFAMPMISGLEVIRLARSLQPGWPAIIISGYADIDAMAARPSDVPLISKPFQPEDLIGAISKIYNQAK